MTVANKVGVSVSEHLLPFYLKSNSTFRIIQGNPKGLALCTLSLQKRGVFSTLTIFLPCSASWRYQINRTKGAKLSGGSLYTILAKSMNLTLQQLRLIPATWNKEQQYLHCFSVPNSIFFSLNSRVYNLYKMANLVLQKIERPQGPISSSK